MSFHQYDTALCHFISTIMQRVAPSGTPYTMALHQYYPTEFHHQYYLKYVIPSVLHRVLFHCHYSKMCHSVYQYGPTAHQATSTLRMCHYTSTTQKCGIPSVLSQCVITSVPHLSSIALHDVISSVKPTLCIASQYCVAPSAIPDSVLFHQ